MKMWRAELHWCRIEEKDIEHVGPQVVVPAGCPPESIRAGDVEWHDTYRDANEACKRYHRAKVTQAKKDLAHSQSRLQMISRS